MVGLNQIDLITGIARLAATFPENVASKLRNNIMVVGGGSEIRGLTERMTRDLIRESPTGSNIKVSIGKGGSQGAYLGMQYIAKY